MTVQAPGPSSWNSTAATSGAPSTGSCEARGGRVRRVGRSSQGAQPRQAGGARHSAIASPRQQARGPRHPRWAAHPFKRTDKLYRHGLHGREWREWEWLTLRAARTSRMCLSCSACVRLSATYSCSQGVMAARGQGARGGQVGGGGQRPTGGPVQRMQPTTSACAQPAWRPASTGARAPGAHAVATSKQRPAVPLTPAVPEVERAHAVVALLEPDLLHKAKPVGPVDALRPQRVHLAARGGGGGGGGMVGWRRGYSAQQGAGWGLPVAPACSVPRACAD